MAKTARSGVKPLDRFRCMVEGCPLYGEWRTIKPGEEFEADTADRRSHYWRMHYEASEAAFLQRVADQRAERLAHYRATGEFLPPVL